METTARLSRWLWSGLRVAAACGAVSSPAWAQCAMCYATAASSGTRVIEALRSGILALIIPTLALFGAILICVFRRLDSDPFSERPWRAEPSAADAVSWESKAIL